MKRRGRVISLHRRIQVSSQLAVLVGYAIVLVVDQQLSINNRFLRHDQARERIRQELLALPQVTSIDAFQGQLNAFITPGRAVWLEMDSVKPNQIVSQNSVFSELRPSLVETLVAASPDQRSRPDEMYEFQHQGRTYISGGFPFAVAGRPAYLRVVEDVTTEVQQVRNSQLLIIVVAGISSLITSALLRMILRRGLGPLDRLSHQVEGIDADSLHSERLQVEGQPLELQPIIVSFNRLLGRLTTVRERQQAFVDGVAHELRTPITLISGLSQRLQRAGLRDPNVNQIGKEATRMARLVTDLLDIARDESNRLALRAVPTDIDDLLLEVFERMELMAKGRLELKEPIESEVPSIARCDVDRIQQCIMNLIENALKYTPEDRPIELYTSHEADQVVVHVRDHGAGVPEADKTKIFERFVRGSGVTDRTDCGVGSGSGIGLSVVKLLMERMGGRVRVADAPGGGADFQLLLPACSD
jgi:signal transduction histidine kinase